MTSIYANNTNYKVYSENMIRHFDNVEPGG